MAKARIKKARIMHAKFADHCQKWCHFSRIHGGNVNRLLADKDIKGAGVQYDLTIAAANVFPKFARVIVADFIQINHACMRFCAIPDQITR